MKNQNLFNRKSLKSYRSSLRNKATSAEAALWNILKSKNLKGRKYRSQRPVDVEAVFGIIKGNRNYRKFLIRGLEKVDIEVKILALSHNLRKLAARN